MITPDDAKRLFENCIGDCDNCKYHYYEMMSEYFYDEPKLRCKLCDILAEEEK